jgi:hypothetical protein
MAFFSEIKARLGLDITPFEKGLSQAQGSLGKVVGGAAGKLGNFKTLGTTLATAMGLNLEGIAEGLARLVVGFSKAQEAALLKLVETSKAAADELAQLAFKKQGGDDPQKRIVLLQKEVTSREAVANARKSLNASEIASIMKQQILEKGHILGTISGIGLIMAENDAMAAGDAENQVKMGEASRKIISAKMELEEKAAKKSEDNVTKYLALNEQAEKIQEAAREKALSLEEKIAEARAKINAPAPVVSGSQEEIALKRAQDKMDKAKAAADLADLLIEKKKQEQAVEESRAAAERARTDKLKEQQKTLLEQKKTIEQTLAAQAKASLLPSMADVVSGKRNIGGVARGRATQLEQDRAKALDLADAEQRAREELASGKKTGGIYNPGGISSAKVDSIGGISSIMGQDPLQKGRAIRAQLDETRSRITTNENLLGSRISDANPNAAMEKELVEIKTELKTLNVTFAPQNTTK